MQCGDQVANFSPMQSMLRMQGESLMEKMALYVHITPFIMHRAPSATEQIELQTCAV
jgi:hypothetical protein